MSEFVYLYRGGETGRSPERMQQMVQKWMAWLKELTEKGSAPAVLQAFARWN